MLHFGGIIVKTKPNTWSKEDDELLATTVLQFMQQGKTQAKAFEHVAESIHRSISACRYRWNSVLRKNYEHEIEEVKNDRKNKDATETFTLTDCITYLQQVAETERNYETLLAEQHQLKHEYEKLLDENKRLKSLFHEIVEKQKNMNGELEIMMNLVEQASQIMKEENTH